MAESYVASSSANFDINDKENTESLQEPQTIVTRSSSRLRK